MSSASPRIGTQVGENLAVSDSPFPLPAVPPTLHAAHAVLHDANSAEAGFADESKVPLDKNTVFGKIANVHSRACRAHLLPYKAQDNASFRYFLATPQVMGLRLMCAAGGAALVALLLLLTAAILRLAVLLVQLVTLRYSLTICALALACWFVDSRRQRYAKGFYSCARVPPTQQPAQTRDEEDQQEQEQVAALVAPVTSEALPEQLKKTTTAPPSETESEDDDSEAGGPPGVKMPPSSSTSTHSKSFADVRVRSNTTDGELQRRQATRPRSSSAVGDSRSSRTAARGPVQRNSNADVMERKRRIPRRRADTGMVAAAAASKQQKERSRRATFASKQDAYAASSRSNSDMLEDALRSDGYWIGDFRVQRRLVPRRSHAGSPKGN